MLLDPVGRGQGCYYTPAVHRTSPPPLQRIIWLRVSIVPLLRNPAVSIFMQLGFFLLGLYNIEVQLCTQRMEEVPTLLLGGLALYHLCIWDFKLNSIGKVGTASERSPYSPASYAYREPTT